MNVDLTSLAAILTPLVGAYAVYLRSQVNKNTKKIDLAEVNATNAINLVKLSNDSAIAAITRADKANEIAYSASIDLSKLRFDHVNLQARFDGLRKEVDLCNVDRIDLRQQIDLLRVTVNNGHKK